MRLLDSRHWRAAGCATLGAALVLAWAEPPVETQPTPTALSVRTISTRADRVSGDDVLVEVVPPAPNTGAELRVTVDGRDVSSAFKAGPNGSRWGLVTGLARGRNQLTVAGGPWNVADATLELTNYPSSGPIVSGPHLTPFVCQTDHFKLPDGSTLGRALNDECTVRTRVQYVYLPQGGKEFRALPTRSRLPADVAQTRTLTGATVPFVVRVETGAMNRGIYQNVILHDPTKDPEPSPFTPPPAWNRRLIAVHGVGCPSGWYRQGGVMGVNPLNVQRLGEGYAFFTNTLNHPTNSCNAFLAGETTMMGKEHFIETFGVPLFTVSMGTSGGAYTSLQVADAFPGLIDGVIITATFPDALSIALAGLDAHLLTRYFDTPSAASLTDEQKLAITGYSGLKAFVDAANQAQRTDPVRGRQDVAGYNPAVWDASVPAALRYHPRDNPSGARPTVFDVGRNIYGIDPVTGFARRPYDNVGVQFGLQALNDGVITLPQFLDLNEHIGGYDHDANYVAARSAGDDEAIRHAYQGGLSLGANGGLASIPVFDAGAYNETERYHYQWFHFAVRARLSKQNGRADNHVMWRGAVPADQSWAVMEAWLTAIKADSSLVSPYEKVVRNKPATAVDGCWPMTADSPVHFIAEPQTFSRQPDSECNRQLPSYSFVRQVAGGPLDSNVLKCQLEADRSGRLPYADHRSRPRTVAGDLPGRCLRLEPARRQPGSRSAVGIVWSRADEPRRRVDQLSDAPVAGTAAQVCTAGSARYATQPGHRSTRDQRHHQNMSNSGA